jgi:Carboxypeptidase regulatory-like domain
MQLASVSASSSGGFSLYSHFSKKDNLRQASAASILALASLILGPITFITPAAFAQATALNGAIQGTVTDSSGAVVPNAKVTITSTDTGVAHDFQSNSAGNYASGPLIPGNYTINVSASGFRDTQVKTVVQINVTTSGNVRLEIGNSAETVQVDAGAVQLQQSQSNVQDVITQQQIQTLPINGRNFLNLAQLEPGVQLQDGSDFDPTKAGYSGVSFSGTSGRTTRILMDGQDITDETVGTTVVNVSEGAIGQFQIVRSTADVGNDLGSTGQVIVATNSGTNSFHGNLLYNFQDARAGFASNQGVVSPFQRNQFGGAIGGPILKDKLFFFANSERIKQDASDVSGVGAPFTALGSTFASVPSPFRDTYSTGRLDWNGPWNVHYFARVFYEANAATTNGGLGNAYSNYVNRDNTPGIAGGADFVTGNFTHSFRGSYEKFHNLIGDASSGVGPTGSALPNGLNIVYTAANFSSGPNDNAPQQTFQSDKQLRYDGSWTHGLHSVRYGAELNRILGGGFASFFGAGPQAVISSGTLSSGGNAANPLDYLPNVVVLGNGLGASTEIPAFGLAGGGQGDWRVGAYFTDSWKVTPQFVLNYGIRYQRDTGRSDADLAPTPCSAVNPSFVSPCSGSTPLLDEFGAGLGDRVTQPNFSFGPQIGFAYSVGSAGKTVIRASVGRFFENSVFNNVLFDRPAKLATGSLFSEATVCGGNTSLPIPNGNITSVNGVSIGTLCSQPLSQSSANLIALEKNYAQAFQGATISNPAFIGNSLSIGPAGQTVFSPNYKTPSSTQVNIGVQREIFRGGVLNVDYVHSATIHIGQVIDTNHVGAARFFNPAAAQAAVATTLAKCGVSTVEQAIAACPGTQTQAEGVGATIADFAANGLDSGVSFLGGNSPQGAGVGTANPAAFPGQNPNLGEGLVQFPGGRSGYDGLQFNFREQIASPVRGLSQSNLEISYAYSKFVSDLAANSTNNNSDVFFNGQSYDQDQPSRFNGFGGLDHRHNLSFGGAATVLHGPQISIIGHIISSAPVNLTLDNVNTLTPGQIFLTNWTGDGKVNTDLVQGTNPGAYMRGVSPSGLNKLISGYNARYANTVTPAGQQLLNNGIFTPAELQALGGVQQPIAAAPAQPFASPMFRQVDASALYPIKLRFLGEGRSLQPGVAVYNVGNFGNYTLPPSFGVLTAAGESNFVNGPSDFSVKNLDRITRGSGTFASGTPRSIEYQMKFVF